MYYNSNKVNSDYYNTYKEEMSTLEDYHEGFSFFKIIKIGFAILMVGLISILTIYLVDHFSTQTKEITAKKAIMSQTQKKIPPKVALVKDMLPKSIQIREQTKRRINPKDVALIVEIIISQMQNKKSASLENQLISIEEDNRISVKNLKESNHYNKVIIPKTHIEDIKDNQKILKENLDALLAETTTTLSGYEKAIRQEIATRSDEMRIIVLQDG